MNLHVAAPGNQRLLPAALPCTRAGTTTPCPLAGSKAWGGYTRCYPLGERVGGGAGEQREVRLSIKLGGSLVTLLPYFVALACTLGDGALLCGYREDILGWSGDGVVDWSVMQTAEELCM